MDLLVRLRWLVEHPDVEEIIVRRNEAEDLLRRLAGRAEVEPALRDWVERPVQNERL